MWLLALLACGEDPVTETLPVEAEPYLVASSDTLAASALAVETASHVAERGERVGDTCPMVTRTGSLTEFTVVADYGEGCVPDSGVFPQEIAGSAQIAYAERALTLRFDSLSVDGHSVSGSVTGSYEGLVGGLTLALLADLSFTGDGPSEVDADLVAEVGATSCQLDGSAQTVAASGDSYALEATALVLDYAALATCPVPSSGTLVVALSATEATLTFTGDGAVTVTWGGRDYEVDGCAYLSNLF